MYATVKEFSPDDFKQLDTFLLQQMSQGEAFDDAMLQARPLLTLLANRRLGFADQKSKVLWGQVMLATLKQLQARNPALCYAYIAAWPFHQSQPVVDLSADNNRLFMQAVVDIYQSADKSMRHEYPPDEKPADFNTTAREFSYIKDDIRLKFGEAVANRVARKEFPETIAEPKEQLCNARIMQMEAMLQRPQAMAAMLIDSILR